MQALLLFSVAAFAICPGTMADVDNYALRAVSETTNGFANNFLKVVANDQPGNLITSPLSCQVVLAMAAYGAGGSTATQMRSALRLPSDNGFGQSGYQSLIETLNAVQGVELRLANKIYTANQFVVKDAYKQMTATKFLSSSQEVDFNNAEAAAQTINTWCEQQTNNRIKDLITPDSLSSDTKLVLVNAVYFKGQWAKKFNPARTTDKPFHVDARTTKNVPTMYSKLNCRFGHLPEVDARFIELPYEGNQLSMIIILPNQIDGLKRVQDNLNQVNLTENLKRSYPGDVEVFLPKFKIESTLNLQGALEKLGMTEMFQDGANFSGIADTPLKVSKVIQKAFIEVNEEGSEAAAATAVQAVFISSLARRPEIFQIDRPFYYEIIFKNGSVPLFRGLSADLN